MSLSLDAVLVTVGRAARDLVRPELLLHALWPPVAAFVLWAGIALFLWQPAAAWIIAELPDWSWLNWLGPWLAHLAVLFIFAPLVYFTVLLLVAVFALPRMMTIIAARDYPDVSRQSSTEMALLGSVANTLVAGIIYITGWLLTLPLLLIPGALFVLPLLWTAWLNQRTFRFDALAEHAQPEERSQLVVREKGNLYAAGFLSAVAAYIPLLNLLSPAFAALLFVHLCLDALRRLRNEQGGQV